ncbi:NYN domain-containing protein [Novosphingobium bradum]|uniref:NYN domain-containing protein n=1 Tax=Novosphingobium bradum TaxID=1737444 RepID=A0ABV7IK09_9SPHN
MATLFEPAGLPVQSPSIALLIDADNVSHAKIAPILSELAKYGTANVRRAYGDWTGTSLKGWKGKLHEFAIRPVQQFSYSAGKNASDMALVIDAMELLYTKRPAAFCLVSSDADFTPLVMHLRDAGCAVFGFGERKTPDPFVNACTTFLYLDSLTEAGVEPPAASPETAARNAPARPSAKPRKPAGKLGQDARLVEILCNAVEASMRDDGWAVLSAAGSAAKRVSSIDPRNYGVKNFPALFEATGLFDIVRPAGGQPLISDKQNLDRAKTPQP